MNTACEFTGYKIPRAGVAHQRSTKQSRGIKNRNNAIGFRRAGERQDVFGGGVVAQESVSGENETIVGTTGATVSMVTLSAAGGRAGIAGDIGGGGGQAVGAVGKRGRRIGPVAAAVGGGAAEQRGAVIDLNSAIRFRAYRPASGYCHW